MTEDMHEERLQAVEAFGDSFVRYCELSPMLDCYPKFIDVNCKFTVSRRYSTSF